MYWPYLAVSNDLTTTIRFFDHEFIVSSTNIITTKSGRVVDKYIRTLKLMIKSFPPAHMTNIYAFMFTSTRPSTTKPGRMGTVCNDLTLQVVMILSLLCNRQSVEMLFSGTFSCFWYVHFCWKIFPKPFFFFFKIFANNICSLGEWIEVSSMVAAVIKSYVMISNTY